MRLSHRLAPAALLAAALALACNGDVLSPEFRVLRRALTADDYAVYSAWLAANKPADGRTMLVDGSTTGAGYPGLSLLSGYTQMVAVSVGTPACWTTTTGALVCGPTQPPVVPEPDDEASQDLSVQRLLSLPLERRLQGAAYDLVSDPVPSDLLSRARLVLAFSRVGFNRAVHVARFEVTQAVPGEWGWPGLVTHYAVRAEKRGGLWALAEVRQVWTSPGGVPRPPGRDTVATIAIGNPITIATLLPQCRSPRLRLVSGCTPVWP